MDRPTAFALVALSVLTCVSSLATLGIVVVTLTKTQRKMEEAKTETFTQVNEFGKKITEIGQTMAGFGKSAE